jgi:hypothetical protein
MKEILLSSIWKYIGPNPGKGELHKVLIKPVPTQVITTSFTYSWIGTEEDFHKQFTWSENAPSEQHV